jgi:hypothetical protein
MVAHPVLRWCSDVPLHAGTHPDRYGIYVRSAPPLDSSVAGPARTWTHSSRTPPDHLRAASSMAELRTFKSE